MTQTLTTEKLRAEMIEKIAVASGLRARDGRNVVAEAIYAAVVEPLLTANREAQPVATVLFSPHGVNVSTIDVALPDGTKLYTAPPAPAVPPEATPENIENLLADITLFFTAGSLSHGGSVMFAEVWNACRAAMLAAAQEGGNEN